MIDRGCGTPVVLIPGIQGRWEWMAPAVDAMAARCRVLTYSLADEPTSGFAYDAQEDFECYIRQLGDTLQRANVRQAVIVGVSYSGLIAAEFAARYPERVLAVVFASALPPGWTPDRRASFYMRAPRLLAPLFVVTSPLRMMREVRAAFPSLAARMTFIAATAYRSARWPASPVRMARRIRALGSHRFADVESIHAPVLVITGEDSLDRIVMPQVTREYLARLPHAQHETLRCTGHLGCVTKPSEFAAIVCGFADKVSADAERISA